jgi:hypothetical protein
MNLDTSDAVFGIRFVLSFWRHRPSCGMKIFGKSLYSKEYTLPFLLDNRRRWKNRRNLNFILGTIPRLLSPLTFFLWRHFGLHSHYVVIENCNILEALVIHLRIMILPCKLVTRFEDTGLFDEGPHKIKLYNAVFSISNSGHPSCLLSNAYNCCHGIARDEFSALWFAFLTIKPYHLHLASNFHNPPPVCVYFLTFLLLHVEDNYDL